MSRFEFTLEDLKDDTDTGILREIHKDNAKPMKTTRSIQGDAGRLSVLSMGQIMMGLPLYNDSRYVAKTQELVFTHLLAGQIIDPSGDGTGTLDIKGFKTETLVPPDILANAKALAKKFADTRPAKTAAGAGGGGTASGNAGNFGGLPADVVASPAFAHTSLTGPYIEKFLYLLLAQQGDRYNNSSSTGRGITNDPNQASFDCSGLVWWATNQLIQPDAWQGNTNGDTMVDFCRTNGTEITVDQAVRSPGALLVIYGIHTAISLGNGTTIDSNGADGVHIHPIDFNSGSPFWNRAALLPMFNYHGVPPAPAPTSGAAGTVSGTSTNTFSGQGGNQGARLLWATAFLKGLGVATSPNNTISIIAWEMGENTNAKYNPLATTQKWPGSTDFNGNGGFPVQNYLSPDDGINATIQTITNGHYNNVLGDLRASAAPEHTLGHFSGGPSGGQDLNTWGTGPLPYGNIPEATQVFKDFIHFVTGL